MPFAAFRSSSSDVLSGRRAPWQQGLYGLAAAASIAVMTAAIAAPQVTELSGEAAESASIATHRQNEDVHVFVKLSGQPAVGAYSDVMAAKSGAGQSELASQAAQRSRQQVQANRIQQSTFIAAARGKNIAFKEIYRASKSINGVAMVVARDKLAALQALPGVVSVRLITPEVLHSNQSVSFVNSGQVWTGLANGRQADGTGIRIGIIDTGIDYVHSHFGGDGALATYQELDTTANSNSNGRTYFPTAKVVGGIDLAGDGYNAAGSGAQLIPSPDANPMDCNGHGTHVAGTAAGFGVTAAGETYTGSYASALPTDLRIQPGVAPKASLYAIRVFGCAGSTDLVPEALDWALDPNGDDDFADRLDVVNMSLGSSNGGLNDISAEAADNAAQSGIIVVASAGNSGDTFMITGSPGVSLRTISVAGSMDAGEQAGKVQIATPAAIAGTYGAVPAGFGALLPTSPVTDTLVMANPAFACSPLNNAAEVSGKTVVIDRGTCAFVDKVTNAQAAGALAVIVVNNVAGDAFVMGGADPAITIPSAMITQADGNLIKAQLAGGVTGYLSHNGLGAGDLVYTSSSRGPNNAVPSGLKPDITAPAVNIVSAQTGINPPTGTDPYDYAAGNESVALSGTSMAAPHVAGLMALLKQMHPTRSVEQLKALAMNSANHDIWSRPADIPGSRYRYGAGRVGSGRIDAQVAGLAKVIAYNADDPGVVSLSFPGEVYLDTAVQKAMRIDNLGSSAVTLALGIDTVVDNPGVVFSLPQGKTVVIPANGSVTIPVKMTASADLIKRTYDPTISLIQSNSIPRFWVTEETAYLTLGDGDSLLRVPLYVAPYAASSMALGTYTPSGSASTPDAVTLTGTPVCTGTFTSPTTCELSATAPLDVVSLLSPFELQVDNPRNPAIPAEVNVRRAGVASDGGFLTFGIQTWGRWSQPIWQDADVEVALFDEAGVLRYIVYPAAAGETNIIVANVWRARTNTTTPLLGGVNLNLPSDVDTHLFQNDVMVLGVPFSYLGDLGITASSGFFWYSIDTYDRLNQPADSVFGLSYDLGAKGVAFNDVLQFADLPGVDVPVLWNLPALQANNSLGALFLHHHNRAGTTAEVLKMAGNVTLVEGSGQTAWQFAPMKVMVTDTNGLPVVGAQVVFTAPGAGASGVFTSGSNVALTGADGIASMTMVSNGTAGDYTVLASVPGLVATVSFNMTNVAGQTGQAGISGTVPGGTATAMVAGSWMLAPVSTGTSPFYSSGGFIPVSGHTRSPAASPAKHVSLGQGLIDLTLTNGTPGADMVVTLTYPQPLPRGTQFWMFGATPEGGQPHWYRYNNLVVSGNVITLTIKDGALGDGDAVANGLVRLLGGPGTSVPVLPILTQMLLGD